MNPWLFVIAQAVTQPTTTNAIFEFLRYGVLGVVVWAMLTGWLWSKPAVLQLLESIKRLTEDNTRKDIEISNLKSEVAVLRAQEAEKRR